MFTLTFATRQAIDLTPGGVAIAEAFVSAVLGTLLGWWLATHTSRRTARASARAQARRSLAGFYVHLWPPTRYSELMASLDGVDADLLVARVSPQLRAALAMVATECWQDAAASLRGDRSEPAISTKLLVAYRTVRSAILLELAVGRDRRSRARATAVLERASRLVEDNAADRGRRPTLAVLPSQRGITLDVGNESGSR